jgi:hypothetical protein
LTGGQQGLLVQCSACVRCRPSSFDFSLSSLFLPTIPASEVSLCLTLHSPLFSWPPGYELQTCFCSWVWPRLGTLRLGRRGGDFLWAHFWVLELSFSSSNFSVASQAPGGEKDAKSGLFLWLFSKGHQHF